MNGKNSNQKSKQKVWETEAKQKEESKTSPAKDLSPQTNGDDAIACPITNPRNIDGFLSTLSGLSTTFHIKEKLHFLAMLLIQLAAALTQRYGSVTTTKGAKYWPSPEKLKQLRDAAKGSDLGAALQFLAIRKLGFSPNSLNLLSSLSGASFQYGRETAQDWAEKAFTAMSGNELFLLYEYLHFILSHLIREIGRAVQQECRDRSRMPSSA
eukprot:TRINITY_DN6783_c0_g1_i1.p1 TRINITY_DN6783_c0_g1~~TRINITY_DN6783_c0_g1_i1.p1  ORF type:complete len:211 (+),score=39.94 TRINITY_DN6783_c0_g1_i1:88-720(+)